jgi:hypothetical protein
MQIWDCVLFFLSASTLLSTCTSRTMYAGPRQHGCYKYVQNFFIFLNNGYTRKNPVLLDLSLLHFLQDYCWRWYSIKNILKREVAPTLNSEFCICQTKIIMVAPRCFFQEKIKLKYFVSPVRDSEVSIHGMEFVTSSTITPPLPRLSLPATALRSIAWYLSSKCLLYQHWRKLFL